MGPDCIGAAGGGGGLGGSFGVGTRSSLALTALRPAGGRECSVLCSVRLTGLRAQEHAAFLHSFAMGLCQRRSGYRLLSHYAVTETLRVLLTEQLGGTVHRHRRSREA